MNIAINGRFLSAHYLTGVERVADELSRRIPLLDKKNHYYIFADSQAVAKATYQGIPNLTWVDTPFSMKSFVLKHLQEQLFFPLRMRKYNIDLVFNPINTAPIACLRKSINLIHCLHIFSFPKEYNLLFRTYYFWLLPLMLRHSRQIVTISQFSKHEIQRFLPVPITVIANGVGPQFTSTKTKKKKYILFVGSLNPRKNVQALITAYQQSRAQKLYELVLVGNIVGSFEKTSLCKDIRIIQNATDQQLIDLYQAADLFVFPSKHEGFGLPPLEAMACGTPVAASNISAIREVCGKAIVYFDPQHVPTITRAIDRILFDKKLSHKLRLAGIQQSKRYSWENAARRYMQLFNKLDR